MDLKGVSRVGLEVNTNKSKVFDLTGDRTLPIFISGQNIEGVDQFVCLGRVVSATAASHLISASFVQGVIVIF